MHPVPTSLTMINAGPHSRWEKHGSEAAASSAARCASALVNSDCSAGSMRGGRPDRCTAPFTVDLPLMTASSALPAHRYSCDMDASAQERGAISTPRGLTGTNLQQSECRYHEHNNDDTKTANSLEMSKVAPMASVALVAPTVGVKRHVPGDDAGAGAGVAPGAAKSSCEFGRVACPPLCGRVLRTHLCTRTHGANDCGCECSAVTGVNTSPFPPPFHLVPTPREQSRWKTGTPT